MPLPDSLVNLARILGDPSTDLCILAEGNVSCRDGDDAMWVKASGAPMRDCSHEAFVEVSLSPVLHALDAMPKDEAAIRQLLDDSRAAGHDGRRASTEAYMHAYLLSLPNIHVVAHSHPTPLLSVMALESAANYATVRLFPDEVVFCGPASCYVSYAAPGLPLAIDIRDSVKRFQDRYHMIPRSIWLQNHGLIALGSSAKECENTTQMAYKAARILLGALSTGKPLRPMTEQEVMQIWNWTDEHFRRKNINS